MTINLLLEEVTIFRAPLLAVNTGENAAEPHPVIILYKHGDFYVCCPIQDPTTHKDAILLPENNEHYYGCFRSHIFSVVVDKMNLEIVTACPSLQECFRDEVVPKLLDNLIEQ